MRADCGGYRANALLEAVGWSVIRVSAEMLSRPGAVVQPVKAKLVERRAYGRFRAADSRTWAPCSAL